MWIRFILFLLTTTALGESIAQDTLRAIEFRGDEKSHRNYLMNFVLSAPGEPVDSMRVEQDVKNLLNTNLFATVDVEQRDTTNGTIFTYVLNKKWTSYPAGNGGIIDDNFWIELGWRDNHFIGRGIRVMLLAKYYDRFSIRGFFQAPYWFGNGLGMESNWEFGRTLEPITLSEDSVLNFNQDRTFFNAMLSYALKPNNLLYTGFEFEELRYTFRDADEISGPESLNEVQTKIQWLVRHHNRHNLNIFEQYITGWSNELILKTAFIEDSSPGKLGRMYPFFQNDFKLFVRPWKTGNVGARIRVGVAENDPSVFAQFIQDSFLNARGIGNKPFRGTAELTANFELRQTIYDRHWIALQSVAFYDYSTIRPPGGNFGDMFASDQMYQFAGIGGRIFFKDAFDFILRADYGIGLNSGRHGFVLGLGQYF